MLAFFFHFALSSTVLSAPTTATSASIAPLCASATSRSDSCALVQPSIYVNHTWYEQGRTWIIRNTFERNYACVTANYKFKEDGKNIQILNKAVDEKKNKVDTTEGNAEIMKESQFKVRFGDQTTGGQIGLWFQNLDKGPNYYILNTWTDAASPDSGYKIALVTNGKKWLDIITDIWILASTPTISDEEMEIVLEYARKAGYNPEKSYFEKTPCTEQQRLLLP